MNLFALSKVPTWRFVFWGVIAALGVALVGWWQHERTLFIAAPIAGAVIGAFGFFIQWSRSHSWILRPLRWLVVISFLVWFAVEVILFLRR